MSQPQQLEAAPDMFDSGGDTSQTRRLQKENKSLRQKLKTLQREAAEEKEEVDALIEELSKELVELCVFC